MIKFALSILLAFGLGVGLTFDFMSSHGHKVDSVQLKSSDDYGNVLKNEAFQSDKIATPGLTSKIDIPDESVEDMNSPSPLECKTQVIQLQQKLAVAEQTHESYKNALMQQLRNVTLEKELLKVRVASLEPTSFDDDELNRFIEERFKSGIATLPANIKEDLFDFHSQDEDLDWGYAKQQQISDFIRTHQNYQYINLLGVTCKVDRCEVMMSEKQNVESLLQNGASESEIQAIIETQSPNYKKIFDDMLLSPQLNMGTVVYMPNRFDIYMLLRDKSA